MMARPHFRSFAPYSALSAALLSVLLVALLGLGLGCGPGASEDDSGDAAATTSASDEPRRGGTVVLSTIADPGGVNELITPNTRAFYDVAFRLFLHLLEEQPDFEDSPPTFAPSLAESWEFSDDHLTLTLRLREGLTWSDGEPITADDVRFSYEAQTHPDVAWTGSYFKANIRDVEVVDERTVRFHYHRVNPHQLLEANEGVILPEHVWGELPFPEWRDNADFFRDNLVVSGPFLLDSWTPQQQVVLVPNPRYHEPGLPYLDRVVFRMIPDRQNQVTQLLSGQIDFLEQIPTDDIPRVEASERLRIDSYWHRLYVFVAWNLRNDLFADRATRQALTLGIDRRGIVETLWGSRARVADSPIVQNVWAHNDDLEPWPHDPERARALLAEAGWSDTDGDGILDRDGEPFSFELVTNQGNQSRIDAAVMIQDQLARIGIDARPRVMEFAAMMGALDDRSFDAMLTGWGIPTTLDMRYAFHSDSITEADNMSSYSNPEVDRLIEEIESLPDIAEAKPLFDRLQELVHQDQPFTFLWESQRVNGLDRDLRGVQSNPLSSLWRLHEWWLADAEPAPADAGSTP